MSPALDASRRAFLRAGTALSAHAATLGGHAATPLALQLAGLGTLAAQQARAADTGGGYKALVCLYLSGGNDSHNWLVPTDAGNQALYAKARGELAWPTARLQAITSSTQGSGRAFGMPVELGPLRDAYEAGRLAWLANVGPLLRPLTLAEVKAGVGLPAKLFSHNDQQSTWQSLMPEGARSGWGGRMGDLLMSANPQPVFTAVSTTGNAVFLAGNSVTQYQVGPAGPVLMNAAQGGSRLGSAGVSQALRAVLGDRGSNDFQAEYVRVAQRSLATAGTLQSALAGSSVPALPATPVTLTDGSTLALGKEPLALQLRMVAQLAAAGVQMGMRRQVFMVAIGGFDSHANQMRAQPVQMARVAQSVNWFLGALQGQGLADKVTLFSASDFGRTLTSNGDGCDHGWGGHHFIAGGAVKGRAIYGRMPITTLGTADDAGAGRLLPSTSVTEYAAALGRWMGLSAGELATVLPNLGSFNAAPLGFV